MTPSLLMSRSAPGHQAGGTLLGFLLGMLFGLAVALGVAVYITKVPLPFMNKTQPRAAGEVPEVKKDWDPNAGLPGRLPPKPETSAPESAAPEGAPPAATPPVPPATGSKPADPLGDLARARSESAKAAAAVPAPAVNASPAVNATPAAVASAPASSSDPFQYFVQAGAYRTPEDAEQQRAKLSLLGLQARVSERDQAGRMVYRVRLGPYDKREDADKARERLSGSGVEAVVVRMQR